MSIFGRTLLINSCLLSKLWFIAQHVPYTTKNITDIDKLVNNYFRKGKRTNSVSHLKRVTPKEFGGLGQLDVRMQVNNLLAKWAIRSLAGDPHPWNIYWNHNVDQLKRFIHSPTHPMFLDIPWEKKRHHRHLFHMIIPVYKAWHAIRLPGVEPTFESIAPMPLYNNVYLKKPSGGTVLPAPQVKRLLNRVWKTKGETITLSLLYKKVEPPPLIPFELGNPNSWRYKLKLAMELNSLFDLDYSVEWALVKSQIPPDAHAVMTQGYEVGPGRWYATRDGEVGDIYYMYTDDRSNRQMAFFDFSNDEEDSPITLVSTSEGGGHDWQGWEQNLVPNLEPLRVSTISGRPRPLGFADEMVGPDMFSLPKEDNYTPETLEQSISKFFPLEDKYGTYYRPNFNSLFRKVRKIKYTKLPQLESWGPHYNWKVQMKLITNCPFMRPKYRQLVYWITTKTLLDGKRLRHMPLNVTRGTCPFCNQLATTEHMITTCPKSVEFMGTIDNLGERHWEDYTPLKFNDIPTILNQYDPIALYHVSALWAIWVTWCTYFHEDMDNAEREAYKASWYRRMMMEMKKQFTLRVIEAPAMTQWIEIVKERRTGGDPLGEGTSIPEKEFLLVHSNKVVTNPDKITMNEHLQKWIAKEHLLSLDHRMFHRPRLRIHHEVWHPYVGIQGGDAPLPTLPALWLGLLPQCVAPP